MKNFRKKALAALLAAACMASACMTASAADAAQRGKSDSGKNVPDDTGVSVSASAEIVGKSGNWYSEGDMIVLSARVDNNSDHAVSGDFCLMYPETATYPDNGCEVLAEPAFDAGSVSNSWRVDGLEPGGRREMAIVLRASGDCRFTGWVFTALFNPDDGSGTAYDTADVNFGEPLLKADKKALYYDGVIRLWNEGTGGANHVKFRFDKKDTWDGTPSGDYYKDLGDGRIEVDLGAVAAGGHIEKDISGFLHAAMDPDGDVEIIYEDWEPRVMPAENWE